MSASPTGPRQVNVQEAKTHLSSLLLRVEAGEEIVLARNGSPCVRLVPIQADAKRRLGFLKGTVDDAVFEARPEREPAAWEVRLCSWTTTCSSGPSSNPTSCLADFGGRSRIPPPIFR